MDIRHIEQILEVARCGSISRAAQRLYISQPNLSYSIKLLENELGAPLFERGASGIRLTDFGKQFVEYARPVWRQYRYLQAICRAGAPSPGPTLSIATSSLKFVANSFITLYQKYVNTGAVMNYYEDTVAAVLERVDTSDADLGIILFSSLQRKTWMRLASAQKLEYHRLTLEDPYVILGPPNPLFQNPPAQVSLDDMLAYPYINSPPGLLDGGGERAPITRHLLLQKKAGSLTVSNRGMLYDMLRKTSAYSISSNNQNAYRARPAYTDIRVIPLQDPGFSFEIGWVCKSGVALSELAEEFLSTLRATLALTE